MREVSADGSRSIYLFRIDFMFIGRKLGWTLSRTVLYTAPVALAVGLCLFWGIGVAGAMLALLNCQQPSLAIRWVIGYALGAYVTVPNYGLFAESYVPDYAAPRQKIISSLPLMSYVAAATVFAFAFPYANG